MGTKVYGYKLLSLDSTSPLVLADVLPVLCSRDAEVTVVAVRAFALLSHSSAARRNFPTLLSLFLLLVGIRVLFVIGVQVVNPLAQLWGPGPNSETMKQLNSPPRRSPKIWFRFWTLIGFAPGKCSLVAN